MLEITMYLVLKKILRHFKPSTELRVGYTLIFTKIGFYDEGAWSVYRPLRLSTAVSYSATLHGSAEISENVFSHCTVV